MVSLRVIQKSKKILFYSHQSFLILTELVLQKLPPHSSANLWAHSLQAILLNKKCKVQEGQTSSKLELESQSSFHIVGQARKNKPSAKLDEDGIASSLSYCTGESVKLLKSIAKDLPENQHFRTELNKPVFKCVLGFARNIDKHSVQQVR